MMLLLTSISLRSSLASSGYAARREMNASSSNGSCSLLYQQLSD